jgi:hypothetical protein
MPLCSELPTASGGRTIDTAPACGRPAADAGRTSRPSGANDRQAVLAPVVVALAALAGFALLMSLVTAPAGPAAGHEHTGHAGPVAADYVVIEAAVAQPPTPRPGPAASTGAFTSRCGRNTDGHRNSDNFITAPGRGNGAHHVHDYVGNTSAGGTSTDLTCV